MFTLVSREMLRHLAGQKGLAAAAGLAAGLLLPSVAAADKEKDAVRPMFDPEALERGAKALREINKSPYAKQVGT